MAMVLGIMAILSVLQHNAVLSELVRQRLSVVVESTASSFNTVVELGLPLSMVRNAGDLLGRAQALDPDIEAIHVFNSSGIVVHSTSPGEVPPLSRQEMELQRLSRSGNWSLETGSHFSSGVSVFNTEGEIVGGVQAIYPTRKFS